MFEMKRETEGLHQRLIAAIEIEAKLIGITKLVLETGVRQLAAVALYKKAGFIEIPPYGEYIGSPLSLCMAKDLLLPST